MQSPASAPASRIWSEIPGGAGSIAVHRSQGRVDRIGPVVICHQFPFEAGSAGRLNGALPELADRIADQSGRQTITATLRGVWPSSGDFSITGWMEDLRSVVVLASAAGQGSVILVGFGIGGALALCHAGEDPSVGGVACFGSPATFDDWCADVEGSLELARRVGVISTPNFPPDHQSWAQGFETLNPSRSAAKMAPRPMLVVHGTEDSCNPVADSRRLADAAGPVAELKILAGAGHFLGSDPRAIAILLGWLDRLPS